MRHCHKTKSVIPLVARCLAIFNRRISSIYMEHYNKVFVSVPNNNIIDISFVYKSHALPETVFTFSRTKEEKLCDSLRRMNQKIEDAIFKRRIKKIKVLSDEEVAAANAPVKLRMRVLHNGEVVNTKTPNSEAWATGNKLILDEVLYDILYDPPAVLHLVLPKKQRSGFPVYPSISLKSCNISESTFIWYRSVAEKQSKKLEGNKIFVDRLSKLWYKVGEDYVYEAMREDVGHFLKVACIPKCGNSVGMIREASTSTQVMPGPEKFPFESRHKCASSVLSSDSIRCISYNILADVYADTETARTQFFPYCPREYILLDYRRQLLLKEITGYNGDILCLQEVDAKVFRDILSPALSLSGYQGVFTEKSGNAGEGLACFYRENRFRLVQSESVILSEAIQNDPMYKDMWDQISADEKFKEKIVSRSTALQVAVLESSASESPTRRIIVGNTHLYFHPQASDIRLVQSAMCLQHLEKLVEKYHCESPDVPISFLFCGDFNSLPNLGVYSLVTKGAVSKDCADWASCPQEPFEGMNLMHSLKLDSACGTPTYTNYTEGFAGCLDYIFYDTDSLTVSEVVPFPDHELIVADKALPSKVFPSDHLALICVLQWKS